MSTIKVQQSVQDLKMEKLTREIREAEQEKELDVLESDIIQKYKMVEGQYQIIITIYEASELEPKKADFIVYQAERSTCDAFVQIDILDKFRKTKVRPQTNNPIFEQNFHVKFQNMRKEDLQNATITFTIYDKTSLIIKNSIIGSATIDWTNIYFRRNHQIYRGWIALTDPLDQNKGITGYLLVNVAVLGKEDKITIHDSKYIKDPLTTIEDTITMKKTMLIDYTIYAQIYRAQHLVPLDNLTGNVNAFVVAKFSGQKIKTDRIKNTNPQWNQRLKLGTFIPNKCKYLLIQVWNSNTFFVDELIGVIRVNFTDICEAEGIEGIGPKWGNIYGSPMTGKDTEPYNYATKMQLYGDTMGSHYRGRLMYKISSVKDLYSKTHKQTINFKFPFKPVPTVAQKNYTLRSIAMEGYQLPSSKSNIGSIQVSMGPYLLTTVSKSIKNGKGIWYETLGTLNQNVAQKNQGKRVMFPQKIDEVPDIFIYFCTGQFEKDRISYKRIKAKDVLVEQQEVVTQKTYQLLEDKSLDLIKDCDCGGTITMKIALYKGKPPPSQKDIKYPEKQQFQLRIYLYVGIGFPPTNRTGDADPLVQFRVDGMVKQSDIKPNTLNPTWFQYLKMDVQLKKTFLQVEGQEGGIMCICYDDEGLDKKRNFIGRFWVPFSSKKKNMINYNNQNIKIVHQKARWYHVQNQAIQINKQSLGKVMLAYSIVHKNNISKVRQPRQELDHFQNAIYRQLKPRIHKEQIQLYIIGLRSIPAEFKFIKIEARISNKITKLQDDRYRRVKNCGTDQPYSIILNADMPDNHIFSPFLQFRIYSRQNQKTGEEIFQGYKATHIYQVLPKLKTKKYGIAKTMQTIQELKEESEDTILNIERLEEQLIQQKQYEKRKQEEQKKNEKARRQEAFLNRMHENQQIQQAKQIDYLQIPDELGTNSRRHAEQYQKQFQQLLIQQQNKIQSNSEYFYIQNLKQKQNDKKQKMMKEKEKAQNQEKKQQKKAEINLFVEEEEKQLNPKEQIKSNNQIQNLEDSQRMIISPDIENIDAKKSSSRPHLRQSQKKILNNYNPESQSCITKKSQRAYQQMLENRSFQQKSMIDMKRITDLKMRIQNPKFSQDLIDDIKSRYSLKFGIQESQLTQVNKFKIKGVEYQDVKKIIQLEQQHNRQVQEKQEKYRFAAAVKLTLMNFQFGLKAKDEDIQTYEDFDTDEQQDLDIEPAWYKGRTILTQDYEQRHKPSKKLKELDLFQGGDMKKGEEIRILKKIGKLKFIAFSFDNTQNFNKKKVYYDKIMYSKTYKCRIYILKGKSLISQKSDLPTTYLKIYYADKQVEDLKRKTLRQTNQNPEYYISQDIILDLPGPAIIRIQVIQKNSFFKNESVLGYTQIDVQQRYFTKAWHLKSRKPIQLRNLYSDYGQGSQGRLETWIQLIERKLWQSCPPTEIKPPPYDEYELRIIVWSAKNCVFKDVEEQCNDLFVRAFIGNKQPQQTDIHWRCRGIGSFNWRFKFRVKYPPKPEQMYSDSLTIQIWDKDVIGYNDLIGETRINLNKVHKIIQKCVKRKQKGVKSVKASMKIIEKGMEITDKMYFDVYNHKEKDLFGKKISQGKVQLSFQLVPVDSIEKFKYENGFGRSQPNIYPTLSQPTGRLSFDFSNPLKFIKDIIGQKIYNKICRFIFCGILIGVIGALLYFMIGQVVAKAIVG